MAVNVGCQEFADRVYNGSFDLYVSMFAGTLAGLVVKYVLDKKYIFYKASRNIAHESNMFIMYTLMGVITTAIFWGTELSFDYVFQTKGMRYTGAIIGLFIGYWIKYRLDKRFVFAE